MDGYTNGVPKLTDILNLGRRNVLKSGEGKCKRTNKFDLVKYEKDFTANSSRGSGGAGQMSKSRGLALE